MSRFPLFRRTEKLPLDIPDEELRRRIKAFPFHPQRNIRPYAEGIIISETPTGFKIAFDSPDDKVSPLFGEAHPAVGEIMVRYRKAYNGFALFLLMLLAAALFQLFRNEIRSAFFITLYGIFLFAANYLHFRLSCRKITLWLQNGILNNTLIIKQLHNHPEIPSH